MAISWKNFKGNQLRKSLPVVLVVCSIVEVLFFSDFRNIISLNISQKIDFYLRDVMGMAPAISPKLKILVFDDTSMAKINAGVLTKEQWTKIIRNISKNEPHGIYIDQMFSFPLSGDMSNEDFTAQLRSGTPVFVAAFYSADPVKARTPLYESLPGDQVDWIENERVTHWSGFISPKLEPKIFAYGPDPKIKSAFADVGHIRLHEYGLVKPLVQTKDARLLPHLSLFAADSIRWEEGRLLVNDVDVETDDQGFKLINFLNARDVLRRSRRITTYLSESQSDFIAKGDYVLILPNMFTGSTDFKDTPIGKIAGGFLIAAMINSVLTNQWISSMPMNELMIFALALGGWIIASFLRLRGFLIAFVSISILIPAAGIAGFVQLSLTTPWIFQLTSFVCSALFAFAIRARELEEQSRAMLITLGGLLPEDQIDDIVKNPLNADLDPKEKVVTLIFIDIEGYSRVSEIFSPKDCFEHLRQMISELSSVVHRYGGVVNKTIGDGMLCYFGHRHDGKKDRSNHAEMALACANEIQRANYHRIVNAAEQGCPVFPLRIGINTAPVYLGDIGGHNRIDFTVIGHGVNYAQRLETACESNRIMMGLATKDFLSDDCFGVEHIFKRYIQIKHHKEPLIAYEFDPFFNDRHCDEELRRVFGMLHGLSRDEERFPCPEHLVTVQTPLGTGMLRDFSRTGFSIELDEYLARDLKVEINLEIFNTELSDELKSFGILPIFGVVRWGRSTEEGRFMHGVAIENLNENQRDQLILTLRKHIRSSRFSEQKNYKLVS